MKKLVIFDLDGTLLNTLEDIKECLNIALEKFGYKTLTTPEVLKRVGYGAKKLVELALGNPTPEELEKVFIKSHILLNLRDPSAICWWDSG